ncbi:HAD family hydrolase [Tianweitania sp. BSSL-BM11]|uniref:phosphoglycolate phosphatase n=1 Tax=Tianweitania aestuarii TaxID=2814886 RepID=A0ABS5RY40_9HYPH|nr:HAD family hydrolase [Tianweitania aestuarii]MBS9721931.1 HAD family hydrolase [Tianweitania aestuarii]
MAIKAILFDKDGTLIDFEATWRAIAENMAMKAADGDRAEAERLLDVAGYDAENRRFKPDSVFAAGTNAELIALWYPQANEEERHALVASYDDFTAQEGANHAVPLDGVREALTALHENGIKLGVATNDSTLGAEKTLLALGIAQMFAAAYGYDAVANPKPAPDVLHAFADMNGLRPSEVAMVGDNRHDLEMARAAGAGLAVGVLSGTGSRQTLGSLADVILGSVADLPAYIKANP